jgi:hypothetical protein
MPSLTGIDLASRGKPMAKNWIKSATAGAHGQFRKKAEAAGETTREFAGEHAGDKGKTGAQARLAETLMSMHPKKSLRETIYNHPRSRSR